VVTGVGVPGLITEAWIKDGALVVDYGFGSKDGKRWGDVDASSVQNKAGILTPVPGGMGPLVITAVLENLLTLALR
jgi:methylenetetrahydrofolate dehydrogenase (NADP+)/methenyltetrahydrofolate cyclohydrolase